MFGERIRQARLLAGMSQDQLAAALGERHYQITKQGISKYENNLSTAPAQFLILAASILDVPNSYFSHRPKTEVEWLAFRRQSKFPAQQQEAIKTYAADVAELYLELESLLYPQSDQQAKLPDTKAVTNFQEAESVAESLREAWDLDNHPIDKLVQMVEEHHVVVIAWHKDGAKFDGLSGRTKRSAITVISTDVSIDRRRFNLAHELGHLLMDTHTVSEKEAEKLAHRFASAFLVPAEIAYYELGKKRNRLDLEELGILKRKYGLSMAAWIFRAKDLGIITDKHTLDLQKEMSQNAWRKREPVEYIGDETPLKLDQMAHRAVAESLMSPDRIRRVYPQWREHEMPKVARDHLTVYDLLAMSEEDRQMLMQKAFELAANEEFETFDAFDEMDFADDAY